MLEDLSLEQLMTRYQNMINFNNSLMHQIDILRGHIIKTGNNLNDFFRLRAYNKCAHLEINENKEFTKQELINACRTIQIAIDYVVDQHCESIIVYRQCVPSTYCPACQKKVTVLYTDSFKAKHCKCGNDKGLNFEY